MISQSRYIKIVSGVGAGATVAARKLIMRLFTQNTVLPPGIVAEFSNADDVGAYFGTTSEEYLRSLQYFAFVNKQINSPSTISFARWVSSSIAPMIVGDALAKTVSQFAAVTSGLLTLTNGNVASQITGINLTTATDLTSVANIIQTAIRTSTDAQFATATVTFNTNTNQFVLTGSTSGSGSIACTPNGLSGDLSQLLGWGTSGTVLVAGQAADEPSVAVAKGMAISNNCGSFAFVTPSTALSNAQITAVALWNDAQNNMYIYSVPTSLSNLGTLFALVKGYSGCALNVLSSTMPNDYVEQSPCEILAAINFGAAGANQNYMFYQFASRNVTVSDDTTANTADASRGNYIGATQNAGQSVAFFQRGVLCGGSTAAVDMNVYGNEMYIKAQLAAQLLTMFLTLGAVVASDTGVGQILAVMQPIVDDALEYGLITAGKALTTAQKQYIGSVTNDSNAWRQVQTQGYWLSVGYSSYTNENSGLTEWQATYKLIYSKGDAIRFVSGTDTMI